MDIEQFKKDWKKNINIKVLITMLLKSEYIIRPKEKREVHLHKVIIDCMDSVFKRISLCPKETYSKYNPGFDNSSTRKLKEHLKTYNVHKEFKKVYVTIKKDLWLGFEKLALVQRELITSNSPSLCQKTLNLSLSLYYYIEGINRYRVDDKIMYFSNAIEHLLSSLFYVPNKKEIHKEIIHIIKSRYQILPTCILCIENKKEKPK